MITGENRMS